MQHIVFLSITYNTTYSISYSLTFSITYTITYGIAYRITISTSLIIMTCSFFNLADKCSCFC